jgi:hypothetical protein
MRQAREAAPEMMTWTADELGAFLDWCEDNTCYGPVFAFYATTGMQGRWRS